MLSAANVNDGKMLLPVLDAMPPVTGKKGRPKKRLGKLHGDKAFDDRRLRRELHKWGITPRLARRNVENRERLGRYR